MGFFVFSALIGGFFRTGNEVMCPKGHHEARGFNPKELRYLVKCLDEGVAFVLQKWADGQSMRYFSSNNPYLSRNS
jgi:hypothetical protein